jgi:hypothetical protein
VKLKLIAVLLLTGCSVTLAYDASERQIAISNEIVPQMISAGALRIDKPACKAWIEPSIWARADAEMKGNLAAAIAVYCSPRDPVIEIYDLQSARKIARWGWAKGLEIL